MARRKLVLTTETLGKLSTVQLARVAGGFTNVSGSCLCQSFVCSIGADCHTVACR